MNDDGSEIEEAIERRKNARLQALTPKKAPNRAEGQAPRVVIIAGQQGAGKSLTQDMLTRKLGPGFATYDADDNVNVHPEREAIMRQRGLHGHEAVHGRIPAGEHHQEYLAHLRGDNGGPKYDMVVSAPTAAQYTDDFHERGYDVSVVYVATSPLNSELGVADRFQSSVEAQGFGRWVPARTHQAGVDRLRGDAESTETGGKAKHVYVVGRDGKVLHQNHRNADGDLTGDVGARATIEHEWTRQPSAQEQLDFGRTVERLRSADLHPEVRDSVDYVAGEYPSLVRGGHTEETPVQRRKRPSIAQSVKDQWKSAPPAARGSRARTARDDEDDGATGDSSDGPGGGTARRPSNPPPGPTPSGGRGTRAARKPGALGRAAGGAAMAAALLGGATGMVPDLAAAVANPAAVAQQFAGQLPDMASELLAGGLGGGVAGVQGGAGGQPGVPAGRGGPATAAGASADATKKMTDATKASTDAITKSSTAVKNSSDGMKKFSTELSRTAGAQKSAASATEGMSKSQKGLNSAMRQNPLGMIVTAITLVIGAVTLLVQNWDKVKAAFDWVYKNVLTPVGKWFSDIWSGTVVPMFQTSVAAVTGAFQGMGSFIEGVWNNVIDKVRDVVRIIAGLLEHLPDISIGGIGPKSLAKAMRSFSDPEKKADGGLLRGPGGPRDDVIPVLASNGEYVVNAAATERNLPLLESINSGAVPRYADGGLVSYSSWSDWAGGALTGGLNSHFFGSAEPSDDTPVGGLAGSLKQWMSGEGGNALLGASGTPEGDARRNGLSGAVSTGLSGLAGAASLFASEMVSDALGTVGLGSVPSWLQAGVLAGNAVEQQRRDVAAEAKRKADEAAAGETGEAADSAEAPAEESAKPGGLPRKALDLIALAQLVEGKPYVWGGTNWGDCSGAVSALANFVAGLAPFASRFATGNEREELARRGAKYGLGPEGSLDIGWFHNGGTNGHTAATLPNGVNFEMGGGRGNGQYGGRAAGARDGMFTQHAHFPPEMFLAAGGFVSGPGSSIGDVIPAWLTAGDFVVNARSTDANRSLLNAINTGSAALSTLTAPIQVPTKPLVGNAGDDGGVDQSMTIHLATPDLDTAFQKAKTWEAQRALTYTGRWG